MDWLNAMTEQFEQNKQQGDEEMMDDEDFYGQPNGTAAPAITKDALPGAAQDVPATPQNMNGAKANPNTTINPGAGLTLTSAMSAQTAEQRKLENQKKAEQLRARLIANRQNTPNRANTPNKPVPKPATPQNEIARPPVEQTATRTFGRAEQQSEPSSDALGIEELLQEGKAAAEAKAKAEDEAKNAVAPSTAQPVQPAKLEIVPVQTQQSKTETPISDQPKQQSISITNPETEYYADLAVWLEVTGYHDIEYRNSKLRTYKERKSLEEEAARIQEKLEKLKQAEQAEMQALRAGGAYVAVTPSRPPPVPPVTMAAPDSVKPAAQKNTVNGIKRTHSPEPMLAEKAPRNREDANNGIRIRGANDSPQDRVSNNPRGRAGSPLDRRVSYPDARRRGSFAEPRGRDSRDPSLERRQAYYSGNGEGARPTIRRDQGERYEPMYPPPRENGAGRGRMGFSSVNVPAQERAYRDHQQAPPRGIRDVDQGRGGVRYFMIKSWNADNVAAAMRDNLWSTQEKNERLLADAYNSSRHIVLCFSVNNSKAFQGYALMASPPDPSLPKPAFCTKLNWPTSPAFALTWLATTAVHFRHVGHIKNDMNLDDNGAPSAVLVGKDGQEISAAAGRGLCEILDEVHESGHLKRR